MYTGRSKLLSLFYGLTVFPLHYILVGDFNTGMAIMKWYYTVRDFRSIFPFFKWEFGGRLFDLFRMTSQGQTFLTKIGQINNPQIPILKTVKLNGSLFSGFHLEKCSRTIKLHQFPSELRILASYDAKIRPP